MKSKRWGIPPILQAAIKATEINLKLQQTIITRKIERAEKLLKQELRQLTKNKDGK